MRERAADEPAARAIRDRRGHVTVEPRLMRRRVSDDVELGPSAGVRSDVGEVAADVEGVPERHDGVDVAVRDPKVRVQALTGTCEAAGSEQRGDEQDGAAARGPACMLRTRPSANSATAHGVLRCSGDDGG